MANNPKLIIVENLPSTYSDSAPDVKRRIIGSIFPEKFSFYKNQYRTKRVNEVAELIRSIHKPFGRNKKGQFSEKTKLSYSVAPMRIELMFLD